MAAIAKYLFDEDFATGEKPTITVVEAERRRADAESQAYRKGFSAGQAQARDEAAKRIADALAVIAAGLDKLNRGLEGIEARLETEAVQVAVAVASKLAPELIAREPLAEITALVGECLRHLAATPHVVVRIAADTHAAAEAAITEIAQARGFAGRLVILPDAAMRPGDCSIEWAEGGVARDSAATAAAIGEVVGRYVAARGAETE